MITVGGNEGKSQVTHIRPVLLSIDSKAHTHFFNPFTLAASFFSPYISHFERTFIQAHLSGISWMRIIHTMMILALDPNEIN